MDSLDELLQKLPRSEVTPQRSSDEPLKLPKPELDSIGQTFVDQLKENKITPDILAKRFGVLDPRRDGLLHRLCLFQLLAFILRQAKPEPRKKKKKSKKQSASTPLSKFAGLIQSKIYKIVKSTEPDFANRRYVQGPCEEMLRSKVFEIPNQLKNALKYLQQISRPVSSRDSDSEPGSGKTSYTKEEREVYLYVEKERQKQKKIRLEGTSRPEKEDKMAQFHEMWQRVLTSPMLPVDEFKAFWDWRPQSVEGAKLVSQHVDEARRRETEEIIATREKLKRMRPLKKDSPKKKRAKILAPSPNKGPEFSQTPQFRDNFSSQQPSRPMPRGPPPRAPSHRSQGPHVSPPYDQQYGSYPPGQQYQSSFSPPYHHYQRSKLSGLDDQTLDPRVSRTPPPPPQTQPQSQMQSQPQSAHPRAEAILSERERDMLAPYDVHVPADRSANIRRPNPPQPSVSPRESVSRQPAPPPRQQPYIHLLKQPTDQHSKLAHTRTPQSDHNSPKPKSNQPSIQKMKQEASSTISHRPPPPPSIQLKLFQQPSPDHHKTPVPTNQKSVTPLTPLPEEFLPTKRQKTNGTSFPGSTPTGDNKTPTTGTGGSRPFVSTAEVKSSKLPKHTLPPKANTRSQLSRHLGRDNVVTRRMPRTVQIFPMDVDLENHFEVIVSDNPTTPKHLTLIWDLEGVLVFNDLLRDSSFVSKRGWDPVVCSSLSKKLKEASNFIASKHLFLEELTEFNINNLDNALVDQQYKSTPEMYCRLEQMKELYEQTDLLSRTQLFSDKQPEWNAAVDEINTLTTGWLTTVRNLLNKACGMNQIVHNLLVVERDLPLALAELMLFHLNVHLSSNQVWSSGRSCSASWIVEETFLRYGHFSRFHVLSREGSSLHALCQGSNFFEFKKIDSISDLDKVSEELTKLSE